MVALASDIAMAQGGERAHRAVQTGEVVAQVGRAAHRAAVGGTVERHEAGGGLGDRIVADAVVVGTELSITTNRNVNYIRIDGAAVFVIDAPFVEGAGA